MRKPKSIPIRRTRVVRFDLSPSTIITIVLVVVGSWAMTRLLPAVLVLVGALVIVGTLSPAVQWLEAHRLRRGLGISIVFIMLLVITLLVVTLTFPELLAQVTSLLEQEPALRARVVTSLAGSRLTAPFAETVRIMNYDALMKSFGATAFALSRRVLEVFAYSLGSIFLGLYMMIDRDHLRGGLYAIVPRSQHIRLSRVMMNLETIVGGYIRGQLITCVLMTVFMFILLVACGVPSALAIAVFGGVADVLPYIGIFLTMGPAVVAALDRGPTVAVIVFVLMLAYEEFESRVLVPIVYGRALRLPSSVVLFALIVGGTLLGIVGALLALPVAAAILMLIEELRVELPGETEVVGNAEQQTRDDRGEQEYERRTQGLPVEQAAAIAVEISDDRKKDEVAPHAPPELR
ncbi:MAG TPA: AI-2E family transporter [Gemmatimonadaceae bacterium]